MQAALPRRAPDAFEAKRTSLTPRERSPALQPDAAPPDRLPFSFSGHGKRLFPSELTVETHSILIFFFRLENRKELTFGGGGGGGAKPSKSLRADPAACCWGSKGLRRDPCRCQPFLCPEHKRRGRSELFLFLFLLELTGRAPPLEPRSGGEPSSGSSRLAVNESNEQPRRRRDWWGASVSSSPSPTPKTDCRTVGVRRDSSG